MADADQGATGTFGWRLSELRRERGLTQAELAARAGVHPSQMHRYEAGTAEPTLSVLRGLATGLGVSADRLIFADEVEVLVEARLRAAIESTAYLSEHEQNVIAEVIEAFVSAHGAKVRPPRAPRTKRRSSKSP